jgi:acyl-CoA thioester hydrolase
MSDDRSVFTHRLVVRFRDCDAMGHVNNAVYFTFLEQCRIHWYQHMGALPGVTTMVVHAECDYRAPLFMQDEIEIRARMTKVGRTSMTMAYDIVRLSDNLVAAEASTVSVTIDAATHQRIPVPDLARAWCQSDREQVR